MIELLVPIIPSVLAGIVVGSLTGLIPGLGMFQILSLIYLFMQGWTPIELMVFYLVALTISQYIDSVPAIYLGVPGESGAIPTAYECRARANDAGYQQKVVLWCSIGRILGSIGAVVATMALIEYAMSMTSLFSTPVQSSLFALAIIGILLTGNNKWYWNLLLMSLGYLLGMVGYNFYLEKEFLTGGLPGLFNGLPMIPAIMGIYVIPSLLENIKSQNKTESLGHEIPQTDRRSLFMTIIRSTGLGYVLGLIPGASYILSGTGSYSFEKYVRARQKLYQRGDVNCSVACETGNSVGAFSTLLPLLFFGIPITISEVIIFDLMIKNGAAFQSGQFLVQNISVLIAGFLIAAIAGMILAWPLSRYIARILEMVNKKSLFYLVILCCVFVVLFVGYNDNQLMIYTMALIGCFILGIWLRHKDTLPLIFVFLIQNSIESSFYNLVALYF